MLEQEKRPLRAAMERAAGLWGNGQRKESLAVLVEARKSAPADGRGLPSDEVAALAEGWEVEGFEELEKGRLQAAFESLVTAERILEGQPEHNGLRGRICHEIGSLLSGNTPELVPIRDEYAAKARDLLTGLPEYRELLESLPDSPGGTQEPWHVRRARLLEEARALQGKHYARSSGSWDRQMKILDLRMQAVYIGIEEGDVQAAHESFADAAALAVEFCSDDIGPFFGVTKVLSHIVDRPRSGLGSGLRPVAGIAMRLAAASESEAYLSDAYFLAALRDWEIGDSESCLKNALASVWHDQQYQANDSPSIMMRGATSHWLDEKRALAAEVALELGQAELVAELIEGARLQALAETAQALRIDSVQDNDFVGLLAATGTSLYGVHPVSVGGRCRVAGSRDDGAGPVPLPLERGIAAVGGREAVYWGSWVALRKCYWAVRSANGDWSAGFLNLGPAAETLLAVNRDLRPSDDLAAMAMLEDRQQELHLTRELGQMIMPPALVDLLNAANSPVSLVVAGGFVCELPLPALVVPGTSDERLVERAVIRVQPPLVLMEAIPSPPVTVDEYDQLLVRLACLDPSGDLPYSRNFDIPSETILTTPSQKQWAAPAPSWSLPADRASLSACLGQLEPGDPGIFVYSGHVQQNGMINGPDTSLKLADGPFSAAELSRLPIPSHVLLSACSSSGASGAGINEWLGLAGSLLRGGARQIIATSWPIPDSKFTARFELEVLKRICSTGDAADALRQCQLDALAEWRSQVWRTPSRMLEAPLPRVWAAFQTIGLFAGR